MNCVSLSERKIFPYEKFMCMFSFFRKTKIERNTKLKSTAYPREGTHRESTEKVLALENAPRTHEY